MRPYLRDHVFRVETDQGVYVRGITGTVLLRGEGLWPWVDGLAAMLDGTGTWEELMADQPDEHRELLTTLLNALLDHGFVTDLDQDRPHTLTPEEAKTYSTIIQYLGEWADSAEHRFERFRRAPVLAIGSGLTLTALLRALIQSGAAEVDFVALDSPADREVREHLLSQYQHLPTRLTGRPLSDLKSALSGAYAVILYTGPLADPLLLEIAEHCAMAGKSLLVGGVTAQGGMIWPLLRPGGPLCWRCVRQMLADHGIGAATVGEDSPTLRMLVGNKLVYEWMLLQTEAQPAETLGHLITVDAETLAERAHRALPIPGCTCAGPSWSGQALASLRDVVDPVTGYLAQADPLDLSQVPLAQCSALLPPALGTGGERVIGAEFALEDATERALMRGMERYMSIKLSRPEHLGHAIFALGRTPAEVTVRGALRLAEQEVLAASAAGHWLPQRLELGPGADLESHRRLKALRLWYRLPVELLGCATAFGPVAGVACEGRWLSLRAGISWEHALYEALIDALQAVQNQAPRQEAPVLTTGTGAGLQVDRSGGGQPDWAGSLHQYGDLVTSCQADLPAPLAGVVCGGWVLPRG